LFISVLLFVYICFVVCLYLCYCLFISVLLFVYICVIVCLYLFCCLFISVLLFVYICFDVGGYQEEECWNSINLFNPATWLSLSLAKDCISTPYVMVIYIFNDLRWEVASLVDIGEIVDHHSVNFLFINHCYL
jgi:hypothetical protein